MRPSIARLARHGSEWRHTNVGTHKPWSAVYSNLPERYRIRKSHRLMELSHKVSPGYIPTIKLTKISEFDMNRTWSTDYEQTNGLDSKGKPPLIQPIRNEDWMWFKGDRVEITTGKDKGKQGYINYVVQERNWVCVEGLNGEYKTMGVEEEFPGYMYLDEKPLLVTEDLKLVDPSNEQIAEVEWMYTQDGERVRVCVDSGHILPMPSEALETVDYKTPKGYKDNKLKDTPAKLVEEVTFTPNLATFEMDIMKQMGIKEERKGTKTYWY